MVTAVKFTISDHPQPIDPLLKNCIGKFLYSHLCKYVGYFSALVKQQFIRPEQQIFLFILLSPS